MKQPRYSIGDIVWGVYDESGMIVSCKIKNIAYSIDEDKFKYVVDDGRIVWQDELHRSLEQAYRAFKDNQ